MAGVLMILLTDAQSAAFTSATNVGLGSVRKNRSTSARTNPVPVTENCFARLALFRSTNPCRRPNSDATMAALIGGGIAGAASLAVAPVAVAAGLGVGAIVLGTWGLRAMGFNVWGVQGPHPCREALFNILAAFSVGIRSSICGRPITHQYEENFRCHILPGDARADEKSTSRKAQPYGTEWTCRKCGKTYTLATQGDPLHVEGSQPPPTSASGCLLAIAFLISTFSAAGLLATILF